MFQHIKTKDEPLVIRDLHRTHNVIPHSVIPVAQYRMIYIMTDWKKILETATLKDNTILIKSNATTFPDNRIHALKSIT
jgi:hypothetical protein